MQKIIVDDFFMIQKELKKAEVKEKKEGKKENKNNANNRSSIHRQ